MEDKLMTTYFYTYNAVFDTPVSGAAKLAYAYLCKCANRAGKCWPSHKAIAAAAGMCVSTMKKALAELESAGLISIQGQARPERGRVTNIYTIAKEAIKGFFITYGNIFKETLTAKARLVYLYFCRLASGRDSAFPAHKTTAKACGLSVSGARLAINELEAAGLIGREAQYRDNGGQRANLYTLVTEPENTDGKDGEPAPSDDGGTPEIAETAPSDYLSCPLVRLSGVDCFMPDRVASLLSVVLRGLQRLKIRFAIAPEYVRVLTLLPRIWFMLFYRFALDKMDQAQLAWKVCRYITVCVRIMARQCALASVYGAITVTLWHPVISRDGYRNLIHKEKIFSEKEKMDRPNDFLLKKNLGALYAPPEYA
jgi:predicted transcriptional regulator